VVKLLKFLALAICLFSLIWPNIDKLDEINHGGICAINIPEVVLHEKKPQGSAEKT
jgi:hypothetical protein